MRTVVVHPLHQRGLLPRRICLTPTLHGQQSRLLAEHCMLCRLLNTHLHYILQWRGKQVREAWMGRIVVVPVDLILKKEVTYPFRPHGI